MAKVLSEEEIRLWRDDAAFNAHLTKLIDSHEELRRRLDAAQTRLQAEAERCNGMRDRDREEWLMDIIKDLSLDAVDENLVKNTTWNDVSRDESKT